MGEYLIDGLGSNYPLKITDKNEALVTGSIAITNASLDITVNVNDFVSVTQSGAYIVNLGSVSVTNNVNMTGSVIITNLPSSYNGSVYQSTNPWIIIGSVYSAHENQRILDNDDIITTINYSDSSKVLVSNITSISASLGRTVTDTYNNSGATTLVITRVVS